MNDETVHQLCKQAVSQVISVDFPALKFTISLFSFQKYL